MFFVSKTDILKCYSAATIVLHDIVLSGQSFVHLCVKYEYEF